MTGARLTVVLRAVCGANAVVFLAALGWIVTQYARAADEVPQVRLPETYTPAPLPEAGPEDAVHADEFEEGFGGTTDESTDDPQRVAARTAFDRGEIARAITMTRRALRRRPQDPVLNNDLGIYYVGQGSDDLALRAFQDAARFDTNYARAWYNQGTVHLRRDALQPAIAAFERALDLQPFYDEARYNLAVALTRAGDEMRAQAEYEVLVSSDRGETSVKAYYNLGLLHARAGEQREAQAAFTAALQRQPDHTRARFSRARVFTRLGLAEKAASDYKKLLQLDPTHPGANLNLGVLLMREERWDDAIMYLEHAAGREEPYPLADNNLGLCYVRTDQNEKAVAAFTRAVTADPSYGEAHYNLGLALIRLDRTKDAATHFHRAVAIYPTRPEYHYNLGRALERNDEPYAAIATYKAALELDPEYFKARYNMGLILYRLGDYPRALEAFEHASTLHPEDYKALYNLGLTLLKLGRPGEAERAFRRAIDLEDTVESRYNLGLALVRQGRGRAARDAFRAALNLNPRHAKSVERLAEIFTELGRHDDAIRRLKLLQQLEPDDPTAFNAGLHAYERAEYETAVRYFQVAATGTKALREKGANMTGLALIRLERYAEAVAHYRDARTTFPDNLRLWRNFAWCLGETGAHEEALVELQGILERKPDDAEALYLAGVAHAALGHTDVAEVYWTRTLQAAPRHREALHAMIDLLGAQDRAGEAEEYRLRLE